MHNDAPARTGFFKKYADMLRGIAVLCVIALVSGLLLGLLHQITAVSDEEQDIIVKQKITEIHDAAGGYVRKTKYEFTDEESGLGALRVYAAKNEDYAVVLASGGGGFKGEVQFYVCFSGGRIVHIEFGTHSETYAARFNAEYLSQYYVPVDSAVFDFSADGFDAIAGATKTSDALMAALNHAVGAYNAYRAGEGL